MLVPIGRFALSGRPLSGDLSLFLFHPSRRLGCRWCEAAVVGSKTIWRLDALDRFMLEFNFHSKISTTYFYVVRSIDVFILLVELHPCIMYYFIFTDALEHMGDVLGNLKLVLQYNSFFNNVCLLRYSPLSLRWTIWFSKIYLNIIS